MWADSIVVLELGAALPAWIDERAGAESNVSVIAQRSSESTREFEARVLFYVSAVEEGAAPTTAVMACAESSGAEHTALRMTVLKALTTLRRRAGRGQVVLAASGCERAERQLRSLARHAGAEALITLRFDRSSPPQRRRRAQPLPARRVA